MARLRTHRAGATHEAEPRPERYEVCELVRTRGGARVLRVLASADDEEGAHLVVRKISEEGLDIGPIWIFDTATRLWYFRSKP
ncbi:MAG: hypothetical protein ACXVZ4_04940 [Gaiellaceae bacterium]